MLKFICILLKNEIYILFKWNLRFTNNLLFSTHNVFIKHSRIHIIFIMRTPLILLLTLSLLCGVLGKDCPNPQKVAFVSYNAMSKQDTMTQIFNQLNKQNVSFNYSYTHNETVYSIVSLVAHVYHNEHYQNESYHSENMVDVQLGHLHMAYTFNYSISKDGQNK